MRYIRFIIAPRKLFLRSRLDLNVEMAGEREAGHTALAGVWRPC